MWLLSQNKELLANVKNARVIYEFDSYHIVCDCDDCDYYYLAEYSTKEKAMNKVANKVFERKEIKDQMPKKKEIDDINKEWEKYFIELIDKAISRKFK